MALLLSDACAISLSRRGFALGSYKPDSFTNRPTNLLLPPQNLQRSRTSNQRSISSLSAASDQINSQNNEDHLRSFATANQITYPVVVKLGAFASQQYYITQKIGSNSVCNAYEAYTIQNKFIDKMPLVLKAFFGDEAKIDQCITEEAEYRKLMKEPMVIVDRTNHVLVYGGAMNSLDNVFPEFATIDQPSTILPPEFKSYNEANADNHESKYDYPAEIKNSYDYSLFHMPNFRNQGGLTRSMFGGYTYEKNHYETYDYYPNDDIITLENFRKYEKDLRQNIEDTTDHDIIHFSNFGGYDNVEKLDTKASPDFWEEFMEKLSEGKYDECQELIDKVEAELAKKVNEFSRFHQRRRGTSEQD